MNFFARIPVRLRLAIVLSFLAASILVGILGRPSRTLLLASALLFVFGGWRISKARSFVLVLILMPALVGLLLTNFDWHHPFLARYAAGLFSVIAALLLMDGIRIQEWIEMLRSERAGLPVSGLGPLLIGTAVGTISLASNIREQRTCRKLANVYSWRAKSRTSIFLDSIALPFYNAVESHEFIDEALHRWSAHDAGRLPVAPSAATAPAELIFGNSNFEARLSDLNDFPRFADVRAAVLSTVSISESWKNVISHLAKPARILEIGDDAGQFTNYLLERGFEVTVLAGKHASGKTSHDLPRLDASVAIAEGTLLDAKVPECSHIFLHHDAFLAAVNQLGVPAVLSRLHQLSSAGAHICFDYPATTMPMMQGAIFSGRIANIGEVEYKLSRHVQDNEIHKAWLEYTVTQEHETFCVRVPLRLIAPELPAVLAAARDSGFSYSTCPMPGAFSFVTMELAFVELQKQGVFHRPGGS